MKLVLVAVASCAPAVGASTICPPFPEEDPNLEVVQMEECWAVVRSLADLQKSEDGDGGEGNEGWGPGEGSPDEVGAWSDVIPWDVIAIHAALLPTGEVLHWSYPAASDGSRARIWNPMNGGFEAVDIGDDLFCAGLSQLGDGRIFVSGGNDYECEAQGRYVTHTFHPVAREWSEEGDMVDGRWYPANVTLWDGSVLIFSGLDRTCKLNPFIEHFSPATGLQALPHIRYISLFSRMHLLSDGRIAHVAAENETWTYRYDLGWQYVANNNFGWRNEGTSVLIPGREDEILVVGGNSPLTSSAEIIDFKDAVPQWSYTTPMHVARAHADTLILPDKTVLVMGGGQFELYGEPVNTPELFDPETETWTLLPPHVFGRMYHATTVLLPDARVLLAGQDSGAGAFTGEIYSPAYLFRGARPIIMDAPDAVAWGTDFDVEIAGALPLDSLVLVKLSSVTHSVNFDQRLVDLPFVSNDDGTYTASVTPNPALAPAGFYMLFAVDEDGVPSVAWMTHVSDAIPGDANGDGAVNVLDLLIVLADWGPCAARCEGDLNGDTVVNVIDMLIVLNNWS